MKRILLCVLSIGLAGCGSSSENTNIDSSIKESAQNNINKGYTETIKLSPYRSPCTSVTQQLCLRVEGDEEQEFELFYGDIENFDYRWGTRYELIVEVKDIENPPADSSSKRYQLSEISSQQEDSINTVYEYQNVDLLDSTFVSNNGSFEFLGQVFECANQVDCDKLVEINNTAGAVNLTFVYIGNGRIKLSHWN
ncbi:DUF4377 domain-containing protein [Pseudoalteromonas luteoviolacea]|uniref:DUF4377 domain-containing protein n=1 Tax=Pseudoalteromonas luteoviolacea (strain 2ta16) TaxID=1353533 RepID=V4HX79_PSEL2|nr:DUF4377 domain-containing protein [Pseudoalteromonas luteoviolacea]ESP92559.1 hypothetical protein PL2TA16_04152 [Pseudoalteromonas luteoviolacea 2ta16]KZN40350.1 hypothetical protein N483_17510 [Pseudoalteromonas luteoviolacea NCIMB 1944]